MSDLVVSDSGYNQGNWSLICCFWASKALVQTPFQKSSNHALAAPTHIPPQGKGMTGNVLITDWIPFWKSQIVSQSLVPLTVALTAANRKNQIIQTANSLVINQAKVSNQSSTIFWSNSNSIKPNIE